MFVSIYYKPSLFNAHTMILIVHIFMNVNKLCLNQSQSRFARPYITAMADWALTSVVYLPICLSISLSQNLLYET